MLVHSLDCNNNLESRVLKAKVFGHCLHYWHNIMMRESKVKLRLWDLYVEFQWRVSWGCWGLWIMSIWEILCFNGWHTFRHDFPNDLFLAIIDFGWQGINSEILCGTSPVFRYGISYAWSTYEQIELSTGPSFFEEKYQALLQLPSDIVSWRRGLFFFFISG